jgi:hypothetical protein
MLALICAPVLAIAALPLLQWLEAGLDPEPATAPADLG